jgi:hypothetical protein
MESLPGSDLIAEGFADLKRGETTISALLVLVGAPRLRRLGFEPPESAVQNPERRLYEMLAVTDPDAAHSRYNALIRRLVRFEHAAEYVGP